MVDCGDSWDSDKKNKSYGKGVRKGFRGIGRWGNTLPKTSDSSSRFHGCRLATRMMLAMDKMLGPVVLFLIASWE